MFLLSTGGKKRQIAKQTLFFIPISTRRTKPDLHKSMAFIVGIQYSFGQCAFKLQLAINQINALTSILFCALGINGASIVFYCWRYSAVIVMHHVTAN